MLERLFKEVKRRTRVVGVFPDETSAATISATEIALLRSSEQWALRRYLTMDILEEAKKPNPQHSRHRLCHLDSARDLVIKCCPVRGSVRGRLTNVG
jgi:hypothetical protein